MRVVGGCRCDAKLLHEREAVFRAGGRRSHGQRMENPLVIMARCVVSSQIGACHTLTGTAYQAAVDRRAGPSDSFVVALSAAADKPSQAS